MELMIDVALNIGEDEFYRASRYSLPLVVILANSKDTKAFNIIEQSIRQTDVIQQLDESTTLVFLSHTNYNDSVKFIEKLEGKLHFTYTMSEFKNPEHSFLEKLFIEHERKSLAT